ncbi:hypothetical protein [Pedobacter panaciterrae]|uniref:hypothetical protein n=1 Tax=Pedobacter panaciterrae TaxID=363849 RepID=UPI00259AA84E|nr:hypothetical protein [uncultured Pedobacter sp.]
MKKLTLKETSLESGEALSRSQLRGILAGSGSGGSGGSGSKGSGSGSGSYGWGSGLWGSGLTGSGSGSDSGGGGGTNPPVGGGGSGSGLPPKIESCKNKPLHSRCTFDYMGVQQRGCCINQMASEIYCATSDTSCWA